MTPEESTHLVGIGGTTKEALLSRLLEAGIRLNGMAENLFADPRFTVAPHRSEVAVHVCSLQSLGLCEGGTFEQAVGSAQRQGLSLCPLELGPHFRLKYVTQPEGAGGQPSRQGRAPAGSITVASLPLDEDDETPKGLYLRRIDGTLWLRGYRSWPGHVWSADDLLAFVCIENAS